MFLHLQVATSHLPTSQPNQRTSHQLPGLPMNGVRLQWDAPSHTNIYLGVLLLPMQNFIWWVKCMLTLQQVCSVILSHKIHCSICQNLLFQIRVVFSHSYSYLPMPLRLIVLSYFFLPLSNIKKSVLQFPFCIDHQ